MLAAIQALTAQPVRYLVVSHWHWELLRQGQEAKERGLDVEQARAVAADSVHDLMLTLTRNDPGLNEAFNIYLVDWFLHRVYDELDGRLTDDIAPIPRHPG